MYSKTMEIGNHNAANWITFTTGPCDSPMRSTPALSSLLCSRWTKVAREHRLHTKASNVRQSGVSRYGNALRRVHLHQDQIVMAMMLASWRLCSRKTVQHRRWRNTMVQLDRSSSYLDASLVLAAWRLARAFNCNDSMKHGPTEEVLK